HAAIGTTVGLFSTVEVGSGNSFTYRLVSGVGGTDNASFSIGTGGLLNTAQVFDFAAKNSYSIRVRETDELNRSYEEVFVITVLHAPRTLIVDVLGDSPMTGKTTLRQAIATANSDAPGDTISFASNVRGTITLVQGELPITNSMTISGPGETVL